MHARHMHEHDASKKESEAEACVDPARAGMFLAAHRDEVLCARVSAAYGFVSPNSFLLYPDSKRGTSGPGSFPKA